VVSYPEACEARLPWRISRCFARKALFSSLGRAAMAATVAAVALTAVEPSLARAGSAPAGKGLSAATATSDATDFSARRRYYRGGGGAAAAAAFAGIVGTGLRLPPRRTVATTTTTAAPRPITTVARPITAGTPITAASRIMADMVIAGPTCPISTVIPPPAGNRGIPNRLIRRPRWRGRRISLAFWRLVTRR